MFIEVFRYAAILRAIVCETLFRFATRRSAVRASCRPPAFALKPCEGCPAEAQSAQAGPFFAVKSYGWASPLSFNNVRDRSRAKLRRRRPTCRSQPLPRSITPASSCVTS
jgi:hypothetical protein